MYFEETSVLKMCSDRTSLALRLYCGYINRSDADFFVVMAQKAFCLFQILLDEGELREDIRQKYICSSALEFGALDLEGKKVAIVDDVIISGSAISSIAHRLVSDAGVKDEDLEIITLARDVEYQTMQFTAANGEQNLFRCALDIEDAECIEMSYELAHILARCGKPYDADFPSYQKIELDRDSCKKLMNSQEWNVFDITNEFQRKSGITAITLFPKENVQQKVWRLLGMNLQKLVHLKVRGYIQNYECGKNVLEIVPMALFHEISEETLDKVFVRLFTEKFPEIFQPADFSCPAKLRLVQFYVSHALKTALFSGLPEKAGSFVREKPGLLFGHRSEDVIVCCLEQLKEQNNILLVEDGEIQPDNLEYEKKYSCDTILEKNDQTGYTINEELYHALQDWYEKKELPAREKLKNHAWHFLRDYEEIEHTRKRLREGFSLRALEKIVQDTEACFQLEYLVSLFIDRGVDEGIIVPIIYYNEKKHYICRAYRHGEDLPFGAADKSRLLYFLQCLDDYLQNKKIEKEIFAPISFEKMLVLFYQTGLKKYQIFNRFLGFDNELILQQRFSVHGIITAISEEKGNEPEHHVYMDGNEHYTRMLTGTIKGKPEGYIMPVDKKQTGYYINRDAVDRYLANSKLNNMSIDIKRRIDKIASVIGEWYWLEKYNGKNAFRDDITALTSCVDIFTFASSIATAVHFFKLYWEKEAEVKMNRIWQGETNKDFYSREFDPVLQSGRDKHLWYKEKRARKVMRSVSNRFYENGMTGQQEAWDKIWADEESLQYRGDNKLVQLVNTALQYQYFYSACYEWLRQQPFLEEDMETDFCRQSVNMSRYLEEYRKLNAGRNDVLELFELFPYIAQFSSVQERANAFLGKMQEIVHSSETVVEDIEIALAEQSDIYTIIYCSVIIIDIETKEKSDSDSIFREIWDQIPEDEEKTRINMIFLERVDETYCRYGIFHEENNKKALEGLLRIYRLLHRIACRYAYKTRAVSIPKLYGKCTFKHNLRRNIPAYAKEFMGNVSKIIGEIEFTDHVHQFAFFQSWSVSRNMYECIKESLDEYRELDEKQCIKDGETGAESNCYLFVCGEQGEIDDKALYSTVLLKAGDKLRGTGFLFSYEKAIYCITCQHIVNMNAELASMKAVTAYFGHEILLKALNYAERKERTPWEDVLILQAEIGAYSDFDRKYIFSEKDCIPDVADPGGKEKFMLYGYGGGASQGRWVKEIELDGRAANKYYQMRSADIKEPCEGDSGAAVVSENGHRLFAMHAKSEEDQQRMLVIPAKTILDRMESFYNRTKER